MKESNQIQLEYFTNFKEAVKIKLESFFVNEGKPYTYGANWSYYENKYTHRKCKLYIHENEIRVYMVGADIDGAFAINFIPKFYRNKNEWHNELDDEVSESSVINEIIKYLLA